MKKYQTKYLGLQSKTRIGLCELSKCISIRKIQRPESATGVERLHTGMRLVGLAILSIVRISDSETSQILQIIGRSEVKCSKPKI